MPGRRLFFQGEMSSCWACSAGYKTWAENARMVSEFSDTAVQKLFQHLFKRETTPQKVKEFQHKFWSDLINISCVSIHVLFWHPRMKKEQWNIKLKTWSDPVYPVYCNEHFQVFFSPHMCLQSSEQVNGFRVYMLNEKHRWHTPDHLLEGKNKNQCSLLHPLSLGCLTVPRD